MQMTISVPTEIEVDAIRVVLAVLYEEENIPNDFPLRKGNSWSATIDINTGQIRDWPGADTDLHLAMKVTDCGSYYLLSGGREVAKRENDYVPSCIPGRYGDYVDFKISPTGKITNWDCRAADVLASFFIDNE